MAREIPWREGGRPLAVLPALGVFGANASGKTNLLRVMNDMRGLVLDSFRSGAVDGGIPRQDFKLRDARGEIPTTYEVSVVLGGVQHDYGFSFNDERILDEWAVHFPHGKEALLFERTAEAGVKVGAASRSEGRAIERLLRPNALYLSTAAQADYQPVVPLHGWFSANLKLAELNNRFDRSERTSEILKETTGREAVLQLIREADLGIVDVSQKPPDPETVARARRLLHFFAEEEGVTKEALDEARLPSLDRLELLHTSQDRPVAFDLWEESMGTQVWIGLAGPVFETLKQGTVLLVDELDASLHPSLVEMLVSLFQEPDTNPHNAQLVFNAFDQGLLGESADRRLGRDQVWFTEKLRDGMTRLYPLSEFSPRKHENIAKGYREGRYGAVPIVSRGGFAAATKLATCGATP